MPYYSLEFGGVKYGRELYMGDRGFNTRFDRPSWADYLNVKYEPKLSSWLNLSVVLSFRFGEPSELLGTPVFRGWQQSVALKVNLDSLRPHPKAPKSEQRGFFPGYFKL